MVTMTARIDEKLQAAVAAGAVPGVVAMAAGPDGVLYECAAGKRSAAAVDAATRFEYGSNSDWLGQVIEAVSGQPLDAYFLEHITGPLGMANTTARMTPEQRANSTPIHVRGEDGAWVVTDIDWAQEPDY